MGAFEYRRKSTRDDIAYKGGVMPTGYYRLTIDSAKMTKNSSGSGSHLALTYKVLEPEQYAGRLIFNNVNAWHDNPETREKAEREMDRILEAIGLEEDPQDTEDFVMRDFNAFVGEERPNPNAAPDPNWRPRNRVVRYYFPDEEFEVGIQEQRTASRGGSGRDRDRDRASSSRDSRDRDRDRDGGRERGGRDDDRRRDERDERSRDRDRDDRRGSRDSRKELDDDIPFDGGRDDRRGEEGERENTENGSRKPWKSRR